MGKAPVVRVEECLGDLVVTSWAETQVRVRGDGTSDDKGGVLVIRSHGDLRLSVPQEASLEIGVVHGDAALKGVSGPSSVHEVLGDMAFTGMGSMKVGAVHGDLSAKGVSGALSVEAVHGDAAVRGVAEVALGAVHGDCVVRRVDGSAAVHEVMGDLQAFEIVGDVTVETVHRDANLGDIGGIVRVGQARGDARLVGPLGHGDHALAADGDIVLRWPAVAPLNLQAEAPAIKNRLSLLDAAASEGSLTGSIGAGKTHLSLRARGRIVLKETEVFDEKMDAFGAAEPGYDPGAEFEALAAQIRSQVESHVSRIGRDIEARFGVEFGQRISEQINRKAEQAASKAERAAEKARRKAESGGYQFTSFATPPAPAPAAPRKTDSTAEQLKILKMVETGTISPEEASLLLEALGA
jgi:hypothetical protein